MVGQTVVMRNLVAQWRVDRGLKRGIGGGSALDAATSGLDGDDMAGADVVAPAVDRRERTVVGRGRMSTWSEDSVLSVMSIRSIGSVGSALSFFSAGSLLSACSAGSILSVSSAGSILSINSAGSILCINADGAIGVFRRRRPEHTCGPQCGHHGPGHPGTDLAGATDQGAPAS